MISPEERRSGERWGSWVRYCQTAALISVALRCISALAPDHPQQSQGLCGGGGVLSPPAQQSKLLVLSSKPRLFPPNPIFSRQELGSVLLHLLYVPEG